MNLGYACINMQLSYPQQYGGQEKGVLPITTGRSMIKRTFESKGLDYASELTLANAKDLDRIIDWNILNGFNFFRITSHPGPFNVLTSPHQHVVDNCVNDLTMHGDVFDMLGLTRTHFNKINIHIGGAYGDKPAAMKRFCENFNLLPESVRSRLTVENDDKASMYSVKELYNGVYNVIGVPIVFDYHHHKFCDGGLGEQEALELAISTWPEGITPATHYSESRREEQGDDTIRVQAHSDYIYDKIDTYGNDIDIMVEAKRKELAVQKYLEIHGES